MGKDKTAPAITQTKLDRFTKSTPTSEPSALGDAGAPDNQILLAISDLRASIKGRIGELRIDLSLIRQDLRNTADRVTETETRELECWK